MLRLLGRLIWPLWPSRVRIKLSKRTKIPQGTLAIVFIVFLMQLAIFYKSWNKNTKHCKKFFLLARHLRRCHGYFIFLGLSNICIKKEIISCLMMHEICNYNWMNKMYLQLYKPWIWLISTNNTIWWLKSLIYHNISV